ncbi:hypothetical protein JK188_17515 [Providencia sp. JGM181]|uniref:hypothetical protein n=1 Tax=unclassified Providencia TaxID=2633465 RepID=UPI001BA98BDF|nr:MULTISPECIES: hypothetical protein [unclassified Providencia]MBS0926274.1 hypothetical protein [Providencia sp. JGM181]MBS0933770.1 hypothetical protein [Providencia sp. JGM172]MBS0998663.1 hypothetical protein [Providencia sp. JGM178]
MNKLESNNKFLELLRKEKYELEHEFNVLRYNNGKLEERLDSEFLNKDRDDFASDLEYYEFRIEQSKVFDEYYENNARIKEKEAKIKDNSELIYKVEHDDRSIRIVKQSIVTNGEDKLISDGKLNFGKLSSDPYNIDATSNRIVENSASMKMEVSVSDHVKSADTINSYYQVIFGVPVYTTGF